MNLCWNLWSCWNNWRWWHGLPDSAFFGTGCLWKKWWKDNIHGLEWIGRNFPGSHSAATKLFAPTRLCFGFCGQLAACRHRVYQFLGQHLNCATSRF